MEKPGPSLRLRDVREAEEARVGYAATPVVVGPPAPTAAAPPAHRPGSRGLRAELGALRLQLGITGRSAKQALKSRSKRRPGRPEAGLNPAPAEAAPRSPAVSVLLTVYNNGAVLQRAIDSVQHQTLPDWELIIVDDGSSDPETLAIVEAAEGPHVAKYRQHNAGVIAARAAAAERASGDVMLFLDPDDWLEPTYLEKVLLILARYPSVDIVCPAVRVHSDGSVPPLWFPAHFEERRLAYENTVPISSAFRRRVWDEVGGMPQYMSEGFEDWGFWRLAAAAGFRGWSLDEALLHYTYSATSGRDASARKLRDDLELRLKQMNPVVTHPPVGIASDTAGLAQEISRRVFHIPSSGRPPLVVFVPWLQAGGGAETFLLTALSSLRDDFQIVIIATQPVMVNHVSALNEFLAITPYVYDLSTLVGPDAMLEMVQSLMYRLTEPNILLVGSPWAYAHIAAVKRMGRGWGRLVDVQFNHVGHLPELLASLPWVDEVLVAHRHLQVLLREYYEVEKPVEVLYIAPPEHALPEPAPPEQAPPEQAPPEQAPPEPTMNRGTGAPLRIGWLGRNSPEKRPDLVATIAAALPEAHFFMAGSAMHHLPAPPENVDVVGWVEDRLEFLNGLDFILNTSDVEGVSVTAMEALQLGVPVITRDVGGMAELITDGGNGLIYRASDIEGLAERLRQPELVRRVTLTAQEQRLPTEFRIDSMLKTLRKAILGPEGPNEHLSDEASGR